MSIAVQVDFLLAGISSGGTPLAGGWVYTYAAGGSTDKTCWVDKDKVTAASNPVELDANGAVQLYADGTYKFVIKNADLDTIYTWDNLILKSITEPFYYAVDYGVSSSNTAAVNGAAIAALMTAYPSHSTVVWPGGTILTDRLHIESKAGIYWKGQSGLAQADTNETVIKQTTLTVGILRVGTAGGTDAPFFRCDDIRFLGNKTVEDVVLLDTGTGYHRFNRCIFRGCSGPSGKGALHVKNILTVLDQCLINVNEGSGLVIENPGLDFEMRGGAIASSATYGIANTAGIDLISGRLSVFRGVAIEGNGTVGTVTTGAVRKGVGGAYFYNCSEEDNVNFVFGVLGGNDLVVEDSQLLGSTSTCDAFQFITASFGGPVRILNNYSVDHTNFLNIDAAYYINDLQVKGNQVTDTAFTNILKIPDTPYYNWDVNDNTWVPRRAKNLLVNLPATDWVATVAGGSAWGSSTTYLVDNVGVVKMNKVGANNCYGTYTLDLATNTYLRGKWVTLAFQALTTDTSNRAMSCIIGDGTTTLTTPVTALANGVWGRNGGSICINAAATTLTVIIGATDAGYDFYVGGIHLFEGIGPWE